MVAETGLVFVLVPPGSFSMGAIKVDREEEGDRNRSPYAQGFEMPVRAVDLGPFFLSKYEVTCAQWKRMAGRLPRVFAAAKALCPVGDVTWREAKSTLTRLSLDFPTEARWEYACRAGTGSSFYWGSDWRRVVEYENTSVGNDPNYALKGVNDNVPGIALIGHFKPNPWGFHDMGGNLTEWCADPWTRDYARSLDPDGFTVNERGERAFNDGYNCVLRGGHHARVPYAARSSYRSAHYGAYAAQMIGLRPVRELTR